MNKSTLEIKNLEQALKTLKESFAALNKKQAGLFDKMIKDSCVKRFEYTVETAWKLMKKTLTSAYGKAQSELTLNNIFRFMEGYQFISSWEAWRDYYQMRNDTSHEYNAEKSHRIIEILPKFIKDTEDLIVNLRRLLK